MPFGISLAVTPWVPTSFPIGVAARAGFIAIILAIPLDALLLLNFTGTVLGALAFHPPVSFSQDFTTTSIVVYFFLYAIPFEEFTKECGARALFRQCVTHSVTKIVKVIGTIDDHQKWRILHKQLFTGAALLRNS